MEALAIIAVFIAYGLGIVVGWHARDERDRPGGRKVRMLKFVHCDYPECEALRCAGRAARGGDR